MTALSKLFIDSPFKYLSSCLCIAPVATSAVAPRALDPTPTPTPTPAPLAALPKTSANSGISPSIAEPTTS